MTDARYEHDDEPEPVFGQRMVRDENGDWVPAMTPEEGLAACREALRSAARALGREDT